MRIPTDEELNFVLANEHSVLNKNKRIRALYEEEEEADPMQAYIGRLCEFSHGNNVWPPNPTLRSLLRIESDGVYVSSTGSRWKHCRPYYCLQMIPHDGRELPRYEQRCLVTRDALIISEVSIEAWGEVLAFLPITATGEVDYEAIEAEGWLHA